MSRPRNGPQLLSAAARRTLSRRDPLLGKVLKRLPPYPGFPRGAEARLTHYESLSRAVVYQQITGKAAATILGRVKALTPGSRFPTAPELLELTEDELRAAGLSRGKALAVRDLAERIVDGRLRLGGLGRLPDDEVIRRLVTVRGIGVWSAQMFLMFKLGRLDVFPAGDLGVVEGLRLLDGLDGRPTEKAAWARSEPWAPWRSATAWAMWRLVDEHRASR